MVVCYLINVNKLLITAQPTRNLQTPVAAEINKRGFLTGAPFSSLPNSPPFLPSPQPHLVTVSLQFRYTFYRPQTKRLRATCRAPARIWLAFIDFQKSIWVR